MTLNKLASPRELVNTPILRWPTQRAREWTSTFLDYSRNNPNVKAVIAVGSAVRPDVTSGDLDLVVVCDDLSSFRENPPIEVDLRAYSTSEIDKYLENGHDMLGWAVKFGKVLYQRDDVWDEVVQSWGHRLPLPSAELSRKRAASAYRHLTNVVQLGDADAAYEQALSYLTHLARAELIDKGIYPASRPELADQLRSTGHFLLAGWMDNLLRAESDNLSQIEKLLEVTV